MRLNYIHRYFAQSTFKLAELLEADGFEYSIRSFTLRDGIAQLGDNPFVSIIIILIIFMAVLYVSMYVY